ncbi:MAG: hypothetical protein IPK82_24210 [Polyangiaceae bacterium]|nr:hypothetical protein [Polyangiaceae bacterium]
MRPGKLVLNGLVIAAAAWMFIHGTKTQTAGLLPSKARSPIATDQALASLESAAAHENTVASVAKLAGAYLDRDQPGLASAVIEKAPTAVRNSPEIAHLYARALLHRGRVPEALAVARDVESACETSLTNEDGACPAWLLARSARQLAFLEEMSAAGIEDPEMNPDGARAAFDRSSRQIRFVAMR